jgi:hypothetical protein
MKTYLYIHMFTQYIPLDGHHVTLIARSICMCIDMFESTMCKFFIRRNCMLYLKHMTVLLLRVVI